MSSDQTVTIVLKNPSRAVSDFETSIGTQQSVGELKRHIEMVYPGNPAPDDQKLIFAGRLLQDGSSLGDVLSGRDLSKAQSVHIVVRTATARASSATSNTANTAASSSGNARGATSPQAAPAPDAEQFVEINGQRIPLRVIQAQLAAQGYIPNLGAHGQAHAHAYAHAQAHARAHAMHAAAHNAAAAPAPAPQAAAADNDDGGDRGAAPRVDGGAHWGLLFKLCMMVFVFSGGGPYRTAFMIGLAAVLYLYQTGRLRMNVRVQVHRHGAANGNANAAANVDANEQGGGDNAAGDAADANGGVADANANAAAPVRRGGVVGELVSFFVPLFLSLLPMYQPPPPLPAAPPAQAAPAPPVNLPPEEHPHQD